MDMVITIDTKPQYYFHDYKNFPFPDIFEVEYVWDILKRKDQILKEKVQGRQVAGAALRENVHVDGPVHIGPRTVVKPNTVIEAENNAPIYIGEDCVIGPQAYIRKGTLIGNGVEVGRTEVKGSVILNGAKSHHHGYIGDSIIGRDVNIATSFDSGNLKHTGGTVKVVIDGKKYDTGLRKFGCVIGDFSKTGCKTTTAPGVLIGPNVWIDEGSIVQGTIPANTFLKRLPDGTYRAEPLVEKYRR